VKEILITKDTTIPLTVDWIRKIAVQGTKNPEIQRIAEKCKNESNPLKCVFDSAYNKIVYKPCPENEQSLRTIENMLREGEGNCVNYSTFIASILILMNVPFFFRTVSYDNPNSYDHIFIVTKSGVVLDPVQGQRQDGSDNQYNRPTHGNFNKEVSYKYKKDFAMPALTILQGTNNSRVDPAGFPVTISRSKYIRQGKNTMGCSCNQKTMGRTWLDTLVRTVGEIGSAPFITTVNAVSQIVTNKNLINYKPQTKIGGLATDAVQLSVASPIIGYNTVTGSNVQPFTYSNSIAQKFNKIEAKAQYYFVDLIGGIFGVSAHDSSKNIISSANQSAIQNPLNAQRNTQAGMGTYALAGLALLALGTATMSSKKSKRK
jgi:hypothetical protein